MRIAICLSGQLRTGLTALPNILSYIGDLLPSCDFFMHTWDIQTYSSPGFSGKEFDNIEPGVPIPINENNFFQFIKTIKPRGLIFDCYEEWCRVAKSDPLLYSMREANELKKYYEKKHHFVYDAIVRTRPDLVFAPNKSLREDIKEMVDGRTLCYAQVYDAPVIGNQVDNAFWISSSYVMDEICEFLKVNTNKHPDYHIDGHMHFGNWVSLGLGFHLHKLKNSKVTIYRPHHNDNQYDPFSYDLLVDKMSKV